MGEGDGIQDFWMYDPATNVWISKTAAPNWSGRNGGNGFCIGNKGYLGLGSIGTFNLPDFWEYTPDSATAIEELSLSNISLYPNPASTFINISSASQISSAVISLFTLSGQQVLEKQVPYISGKTEIDLPQLSDGIYFLKINSSNSSFSQKIVIQN
jgi:hypothetical protein